MYNVGRRILGICMLKYTILSCIIISMHLDCLLFTLLCLGIVLDRSNPYNYAKAMLQAFSLLLCCCQVVLRGIQCCPRLQRSCQVSTPEIP